MLWRGIVLSETCLLLARITVPKTVAPSDLQPTGFLNALLLDAVGRTQHTVRPIKTGIEWNWPCLSWVSMRDNSIFLEPTRAHTHSLTRTRWCCWVPKLGWKTGQPAVKFRDTSKDPYRDTSWPSKIICLGSWRTVPFILEHVDNVGSSWIFIGRDVARGEAKPQDQTWSRMVTVEALRKPHFVWESGTPCT